MDNLQTLETSVLIELLAQHTIDYTKLMQDGSKEDFDRCKIIMTQLQAEINSRKPTGDTSITDTNIHFEDESATDTV